MFGTSFTADRVSELKTSHPTVLEEALPRSSNPVEDSGKGLPTVEEMNAKNKQTENIISW